MDCVIEKSQVNSKRRMVYLVQPWDVAMFQEDIADILHGQATLDQVIARNKGADLADILGSTALAAALDDWGIPSKAS